MIADLLPKLKFGSEMGQNLKTPKGEISITNCQGRIRLRWRYAGNRYSLNLPFAYNPENIHHATVKVTEIKLDMIKGCFDGTLEKYQHYSISQKRTKEKQIIHSTSIEKIVCLNDLVPKFNEWVKNIRNIDIDNSIDYLYLRRWLEKSEGVSILNTSKKLNSEKWSITTYNKRLYYMKTFLNWLNESGIIEFNPLKSVCKKKEKGKMKSGRRKPLEENEIIALLEAIKNDTYCPSVSRYKHSFYYSFLAFIFHTGVRNAEAIGLKVKHIDLENCKVEISQALARTVKGANHAARIEKCTKMGNVRFLPCTGELLEILKTQVQNKNSDDLVFQSPKGLSIDDRMLNRRILKPVLLKLGIGNRDLYAARHSFGTRAVQQGMALTDVAYLMGHSTVETTMRNYVSVTRPVTSLPVIGKQ